MGKPKPHWSCPYYGETRVERDSEMLAELVDAHLQRCNDETLEEYQGNISKWNEKAEKTYGKGNIPVIDPEDERNG